MCDRYDLDHALLQIDSVIHKIRETAQRKTPMPRAYFATKLGIDLYKAQHAIDFSNEIYRQAPPLKDIEIQGL